MVKIRDLTLFTYFNRQELWSVEVLSKLKLWIKIKGNGAETSIIAV